MMRNRTSIRFSPLLLVIGLLLLSSTSIFAASASFADDLNDIKATWFRPLANREGLFIVDATETIGGLTAPTGNFRVYGEPGGNFVFANAWFPVEPGSWELEFDAKMVSLGTFLPGKDLNVLSPYRGFTIGVRFSDGRLYVVGYNHGILGVLGSNEKYARLDPRVVGEPESEYHTWKIVFHYDQSSMVITKDGIKVAEFTGVVGGTHKEQDGGLRIYSAPIDISGTVDVLLDKVTFVRTD